MWGVQAMTVSSLNSSAFSYFRSQCTTVQNKYSSIWWCKHRKKMSDHVPGHSGGVSGVRPGDTALLVLIWSLVSSCHWSYSLTDNWVQTLIIRLIYFEGKCTSLHTVFTCFNITLAFTESSWLWWSHVNVISLSCIWLQCTVTICHCLLQCSYEARIISRFTINARLTQTRVNNIHFMMTDY